MESQVLPFIHHCFESKKITQDQYEICLSQCLDHVDLEFIHECFKQFNLLDDFRRYQQSYKHQLKFNRFQQNIISDKISKLTTEILALENEIIRLKNQIDPEVIVKIEYWKDRSSHFPDNPRFRAEVEKHQRLIDLNLASYQPLEINLAELKNKRERLFDSLGELLTPSGSGSPSGSWSPSGSGSASSRPGSRMPDLI